MELRNGQQHEPLLSLLGGVLGSNTNCFLKEKSTYETLRMSDLEKQSELLQMCFEKTSIQILIDQGHKFIKLVWLKTIT